MDKISISKSCRWLVQLRYNGIYAIQTTKNVAHFSARSLRTCGLLLSKVKDSTDAHSVEDSTAAEGLQSESQERASQYNARELLQREAPIAYFKFILSTKI